MFAKRRRLRLRGGRCGEVRPVFETRRDIMMGLPYDDRYSMIFRDGLVKSIRERRRCEEDRTP